MMILVVKVWIIRNWLFQNVIQSYFFVHLVKSVWKTWFLIVASNIINQIGSWLCLVEMVLLIGNKSPSGNFSAITIHIKIYIEYRQKTKQLYTTVE